MALFKEGRVSRKILRRKFWIRDRAGQRKHLRIELRADQHADRHQVKPNQSRDDRAQRPVDHRVIRKADEIDKLARNVREKMKNAN